MVAKVSTKHARPAGQRDGQEPTVSRKGGRPSAEMP